MVLQQICWIFFLDSNIKYLIQLKSKTHNLTIMQLRRAQTFLEKKKKKKRFPVSLWESTEEDYHIYNILNCVLEFAYNLERH